MNRRITKLMSSFMMTAVLTLVLAAAFTLQIKADDQIDISGGSCVMTLDSTPLYYDGTEKAPVVTLKYNGNSLTAGTDYDITTQNAVNAGTATIIVTGKGKYKGQKSENYIINKADQVLTLTANPPSVKLNQRGKITVTSTAGNQAGALSFQTSDNTLLAVNTAGGYRGKATGKPVVTVTAAGSQNYNSATATIQITVVGIQLTKSNTRVTLSKSTYTYNGSTKKPGVTVKFKGKKLKRNKDYKVVYYNCTNAGKAYAAVYGKGKYSGGLRKYYTIKKAKNTLKATMDDTHLDIGEEEQINVRYANGPVTFKSNRSDIASVSSTGLVRGKKNGTCTITVTAAGDVNHYKATKQFTVYSGETDIKSCKVTLSNSDYVYDGSYKKPAVTVKFNGTKLVKDTDYTVTYYNNKNAGQASISIRGIGRFYGKRTVYFNIAKAEQKNMQVTLADNHIPLGDSVKMIVTGAKGDLTFGCNSPTYATASSDGYFTGLKKTKDSGVTIYVVASGDANYKSKRKEIRVQIY